MAAGRRGNGRHGGGGCPGAHHGDGRPCSSDRTSPGATAHDHRGRLGESAATNGADTSRATSCGTSTTPGTTTSVSVIRAASADCSRAETERIEAASVRPRPRENGQSTVANNHPGATGESFAAVRRGTPEPGTVERNRRRPGHPSAIPGRSSRTASSCVGAGSRGPFHHRHGWHRHGRTGGGNPGPADQSDSARRISSLAIFPGHAGGQADRLHPGSPGADQSGIAAD